MPKWVSRIKLTITEIEAKQMKDLCLEHYIDYGMKQIKNGKAKDGEWYSGYDCFSKPNWGTFIESEERNSKNGFINTWNSRYGKTFPYSPDLWVWCIRVN